MPFINGRYYANPAYGHALENARIESTAYDSHLDEFPASHQGTQVPATGDPQSRTPKREALNINKFVRWMDLHARDKSQRQCGAYCRRGLEAGGLDEKDHPMHAKDYGPFLLGHGASVVPQTNYTPQKADIAVFDGNQAHPSGHIEVFDGTGWVSDFKQSHFSPYMKHTPPSTIYRFSDN